MNRLLFLLAAGALSLATFATASAQTSEDTEFVDNNGDGINDDTATDHQSRRISRRQAIAHARGIKEGQRQVIMAGLSDEQKSEVQGLVSTLKEQGEDRAVIHAQVGELLVGFGVDLPENWNDSPRDMARRHASARPLFEALLTDEQKAEVKAAVDALKAGGADRETIHAQVGELLVGFGVDLPDNWDQLRRRGPGGEAFGSLTDEQQTEIRTLIESLKTNGADRKAIHEAVKAKFEEYGITLPPRPSGRRGRR